VRLACEGDARPSFSAAPPAMHADRMVAEGKLCAVLAAAPEFRGRGGAEGDAGEYDGGDEEREESAAARELLRLTCNGLERMGDGAEEDDVKDDAAKLEVLLRTAAAGAGAAAGQMWRWICGLQRNGRGNTTLGGLDSASSSATMRSNSKRDRCVTQRRVRCAR
jgi:hypothetical protein